MSTPPDSRRKGALAQIARRAMQAHGFLPDFSAAAIKELETVQPVDRGVASPGIDLRHLLWASIDNDDSLDLDQLTVAEALTNEVRVALDALHFKLELGIKLLMAALLLLLMVPVHGLWRQRRRMKNSLSQFSDDLGQGDWQDAVQALRNDRQGPPSAFDALASGVAGVLGDSDRRWQALADLSADWYWETDPQHRLVRLFGSVSVLRQLGWQTDDVVGWRHDQIAFFRAPRPGGWDAPARSAAPPR
mgnify:CR=1 FL=1